MTLVDSARNAIHSPAFKFLVVLALILALAIPLLFVYGLVWERERYADRAANEVSAMWARAQTLSGPYLVIPTERTVEVQRGQETTTRTVRDYAVFRPEALDVEATLTSEIRKRGIFEIPVYRSAIAAKGRFVTPDLQRVVDGSDRLLWDQAVLSVLIPDVRGIKETTAMTVAGESVRFRAGAGVGGSPIAGIHIPIDEARARAGFDYAFTLPLNGSKEFHVVPAGAETSVSLKSDWPHPSFSGAFLPETRSVTDAGFEATWKIPRLARGDGQERRVNSLQQMANPMAFGAELFQPVRFYSLAQRALKYALGFIAIAFLAVFIMEIQTRRRVHWIQYLFVGLAHVIFYVLLIGTAEHIGFDYGYTGAAAATALLIGTYFGTVVRSAPRGLVMFGVLAVIYAMLYLLLRLEDYALLAGSISAFVLIAIVMFATRDVDWSRGAEPHRDDAPRVPA
jgi:inner membrane protein